MDWYKMSFYDATSPIMEQLILFHDYSMLIISSILSMVFFIMIKLMKNNFFSNMILENQKIEMIWTILPTLILTFIAIPSLHLLYTMDELMNPMVTIKIIAHQWFWTYEYNDFNQVEFESYMNPSSIIRFLEVDNSTPIPINCQIRFIITSTDVIHSWTIPSLGIKMDATPGRLNQISIISNKSGSFFGQCSEICGMNHSFMPIMIDSIPIKYFISWIKSFN
uniref:Cytochrome c oxidase subunit 2 n=1 Tax=Mycopsylla fici TaxID=1681222 RepID=A0A343UQS1_9HEMI|nr:cytochrome c oxidase subunit II [Mycopsylla fici]AVF97046.1 cytochrome c oxidase subunit II [Mycopsylla fici]